MRTTVASLLAAILLAACAKPDPAPQDTPPPASPTGDAPAATPAPPELPPPDQAPTGPAQPSPEAPPPTDPSPAPKPTSSQEEAPAVESMRLAKAGGKIGVPVDLRYSFGAAPLPNQPVVLHLAAVPRVDGSQLRVSIQQAEGIEVSSGALNVQKASAAGVYRQQYALTRQATAPAELRVLVTLGVGEGSAHGFYSIPLDGENSARNQDSVKQR